jgi:hypothetical protein
MAISRMQEPQQIQRGLGSLDVPRQKYGLGKLVKKAVRGVKKIVKSPIGKAAITAGLMGAPFGGGSWFGAGSGWGKLSGMMGGLGKAKGTGGFFTKGLGRFLNPWSSGQFSGKHAFGLGAAALTAMPFLMGKDEPEEEVEESWTSVPSNIADIRNQAKDYYRNPASSTLAFMPGKQFVNANYYAADGGRVGLLNGGEAGQEQIEQMLMAEFVKYKNQGGKLSFEEFVQAVMQAQQEQQPEGAGMEQPQEVMMAANGGRIGFSIGGDKKFMDLVAKLREEGFSQQDAIEEAKERLGMAQGGRIGAYAGGLMGEDEDEYAYNPQAAMRMYKRPGKQEGGIMETEVADEMIDLGGKEKDYRETGGFVDLGGKERADDVPARLSKNEFVFTADAVRNAGGGDIDKGSEVMQNLMDNLEAGGEVSEDSQGLEGAQAMYDQQQMLQSRIA